MLLQIDGQHVISIPEAKSLIVGEEGTKVKLGIFRQSKGEFQIELSRLSTALPSRGSTAPPPSSSSGTSSNGPCSATASTDPGSWSVKELKQALTEAGVAHGWATEKSDLVILARENKVFPPGAPGRSSGGSTRTPQGTTFDIIFLCLCLCSRICLLSPDIMNHSLVFARSRSRHSSPCLRH